MALFFKKAKDFLILSCLKFVNSRKFNFKAPKVLEDGDGKSLIKVSDSWANHAYVNESKYKKKYKLSIKENDKFARLSFRLDTVKDKLCELIFTCGKLSFPCDHAGYLLSFESNTADDTIHWWFGGVNFTLYRSRKHAGSRAALPIAIYARRILLNCRGCRFNVWS